MFVIDLQDEDGNRLSLSESVTMEIPVDLLGNATVVNGQSEVFLWSMNPDTGLWEEESPIILLEPDETESSRKKRQTLSNIGFVSTYRTIIHGIPVGYRYRNLDLRMSQTCHSKTRLYDEFHGFGGKPVANARVSVIMQGRPNRVSQLLSRYNGDGSNGYCIAHPCFNGARAYVAVAYDNTEMEPVPRDQAHTYLSAAYVTSLNYQTVGNLAEVEMDRNAVGSTGPLYNYYRKWTRSVACENAGEEHFHFRFKKPSPVICEPREFDPYSIATLPSGASCDYRKYQLWLPLRDNYNKLLTSTFQHVAYYIKVKLPDVDDVFRVQARSVMVDPRHDARLRNQPYGSREKCNDNVVNGQRDTAVCVEIRVPKTCHCGLLNSFDIDEEYTQVEVRVTSHADAQVAEVDSDIDSGNVMQGAGQAAFVMRVAAENYGTEFGIYRGVHGSSYDEAKKHALFHCKNSNDNANTDPGTTDPTAYAVRFTTGAP